MGGKHYKVEISLNDLGQPIVLQIESIYKIYKIIHFDSHWCPNC
jgi:hypothetical protein